MSAPPFRRSGPLRLSVVVAGFVVTGVVAGIVWEWWWTPPTGVTVDGEWYLDPEGVQDDFSGTGVYVVVALVAGLLLGIVSALTARSHELATLVAVAVGSAAAAGIMALTGAALGPPDPRPLAQGREDRTEIASDLGVVGATPYAALPAGALTGLAVLFVGTHGSPARRSSEG